MPAANAPCRGTAPVEILQRRGLTLLPDPLVNAGDVIADSIERYAPEAWAAADPEQVYSFVAATIHARSREFLESQALGEDSPTALLALSGGGNDRKAAPIGTRFPTR